MDYNNTKTEVGFRQTTNGVETQNADNSYVNMHCFSSRSVVYIELFAISG